MRGMLLRAVKAAKLDRATYREVSDDPDAILNAAGIVVLAGLAMGLGLMGLRLGGEEAAPSLDSLADRLVGVWFAIITMLDGWMLWAAVVFLAGKLFLRGDASFRQILRVLGICFGPGVLLVMMSAPPLETYVLNIGTLWVLAAGVVALHEIQQVDWMGASLSSFLGWLICYRLLPTFALVPYL